MPKRWLTITPTQAAVKSVPSNGLVVLQLDVSDPSLGLAPGLGVQLSLAPEEARQVAAALERKAHEATGG